MRSWKLILLVLSAQVLLFIVSCGSEYKTDFPPPPPNAALDDVFPKQIDGMESSITRMMVDHPLEGFRADYGKGKIQIEGILSPDKERAEKYFDESIAPNIDSMKIHSKGNFDGMKRIEGTEENGRKWIAWTNDRWVFVLGASDSETMEKTIDAFKYISK